MSVFLFSETVFGPVHSRRLGISLGVNLLPNNSKLCNFNCIYCECGFTRANIEGNFNSRAEVYNSLKDRLIDIKGKHGKIDAITFAGNGEPTMHPDFPQIIDDTIELRNIYFAEAKIAVLSNATLIGNPAIVNALKKVDFNILKLDSAFDSTVKLINAPLLQNFNVQNLVNNLKQFEGNLTIQTLFVKGKINSQIIDNSTTAEVDAWLKLLSEIQPAQVMIYTIARSTPIEELERIDIQQLEAIATRVNKLGFKTLVSG